MLHKLIKEKRLSTRCLLNKYNIDSLKDPWRDFFWLDFSKNKKRVL